MRILDKSQPFVARKTMYGYDSVIGLEDAKTFVRGCVMDPKGGIRRDAGHILLCGMPATGKSLFARSTAAEMDACYIPVVCSMIFSKYVGEAEMHVRQLFEEARRHDRTVIELMDADILLEDCCGLLHKKRMVQEICRGLEDPANSGRVLVIATCCEPWRIDRQAFFHFDHRFYCPLPDFNCRREMLVREIAALPGGDRVCPDELAERSAGWNYPELKMVAERLKSWLVSMSMEGKEAEVTQDEARQAFEAEAQRVQAMEAEEEREYMAKCGFEGTPPLR